MKAEPAVSDPSLCSAALRYAARGWAVFPLHGFRDGRCTCGQAACEHPGKHPRTSHGCKNARRKALRRLNRPHRGRQAGRQADRAPRQPHPAAEEFLARLRRG